jgi:hypothetical protein
MRLIALKAMLNQLVIRNDSVTKLEGVIMAIMTGESCPRPQCQQHNGCAGKLQILHYYLLFPKMSCIAGAPPQRPSLTAAATRELELRDSGLIGQSKRNGVEMVQCQQSKVSINGAPHDDPARSNDDPAQNDDRAAGDDGAARPSATGAINTASANNGVRLFEGGHHGPHHNEGGGDVIVVFFIPTLPNRILRW